MIDLANETLFDVPFGLWADAQRAIGWPDDILTEYDPVQMTRAEIETIQDGLRMIGTDHSNALSSEFGLLLEVCDGCQ